jgi:hypothetical protein
MKTPSHIFLFTGIFALAMGLLETIVVVYLRQIYYPAGFEFPLVEFSPFMMKVELLREAATIIMLVTVGILAGKNFNRSFAFFIYTFALWDISYYIGLKLLLNWPASLLTWDILFLIPVVWVGPVLAPVLCSLAMITLAVIIVLLENKKVKPVVSRLEWFLFITGSLVVLWSFLRDYSLLLIKGHYLSQLSTLESNQSFHQAIDNYIPSWFDWPVFCLGIVLIMLGIGRMLLRLISNKSVSLTSNL